MRCKSQECYEKRCNHTYQALKGNYKEKKTLLKLNGKLDTGTVSLSPLFLGVPVSIATFTRGRRWSVTNRFMGFNTAWGFLSWDCSSCCMRVNAQVYQDSHSQKCLKALPFHVQCGGLGSKMKQRNTVGDCGRVAGREDIPTTDGDETVTWTYICGQKKYTRKGREKQLLVSTSTQKQGLHYSCSMDATNIQRLQVFSESDNIKCRH